MIGPFVNGASVLAGGVSGSLLGRHLGENLRNRMPMAFGVVSMGLGVAMIVRVRFLPAAALAFVLGTIVGELLRLEERIQRASQRTRGLVERFAPPAAADLGQEVYLERFVALLVLFCASGMGVFGAMNEGMSGDPSLLLVKSILDCLTAAIFATSLGPSVAAIAVPQLAVQTSLFFLGRLVLPLTDAAMVADFSAVGGLIMVATGLRVAGIKAFAVANMVPALFLAMPITALWARFAGPG